MTRVARRSAVLALIASLALAPVGTAAAETLSLAGGSDKIHKVEPGETLWSIASRVLGSAFLWPFLYKANRDQIKNPHLVYPGQDLAIPEVEPRLRNASSPSALR